MQRQNVVAALRRPLPELGEPLLAAYRVTVSLTGAVGAFIGSTATQPLMRYLLVPACLALMGAVVADIPRPLWRWLAVIGGWASAVICAVFLFAPDNSPFAWIVPVGLGVLSVGFARRLTPREESDAPPTSEGGESPAEGWIEENTTDAFE